MRVIVDEFEKLSPSERRALTWVLELAYFGSFSDGSILDSDLASDGSLKSSEPASGSDQHLHADFLDGTEPHRPDPGLRGGVRNAAFDPLLLFLSQIEKPGWGLDDPGVLPCLELAGEERPGRTLEPVLEPSAGSFSPAIVVDVDRDREAVGWEHRRLLMMSVPSSEYPIVRQDDTVKVSRSFRSCRGSARPAR
jgi:hypothetical protein